MTQEQSILFSLIQTAIYGKGEELTQCDEEKLISLCQEQGVCPLVFAGVRLYNDQLGTKVLDTEAILQLYTIVELQKKQMQQKKQLSLDFVQKLSLPCVVLKGLDYCRFWPNENWREFGDLDIYSVDGLSTYELINKRAAEIGCKVDDYGYYKHISIYYKNLMIENHRFLTKFDGTRSGKILEKAARMWINKDCETIADNMLVPNPNFTALYILLHAHQHFFQSGIVLKQILDWNFFLMKHEKNVDWTAVIDLLEQAKIRGIYDILTAFCVKYFGLQTSLSYKVDNKELEHFCNIIFSNEYTVNKFLQLFYRFRRMWKYRSFNGENLYIRIINTLKYNYLHKMPQFDFSTHINPS